MKKCIHNQLQESEFYQGVALNLSQAKSAPKEAQLNQVERCRRVSKSGANDVCKNRFLKLIVYIWLVAVFFLLGHAYYILTGDFRSSYLLKTEGVENSQKSVPPISKTFTYLGQGHQTYAFLSEDQKIVLKLFKKEYFRRTALVQLFPPIPPFRSFFLHTGKSRAYRKLRLLRGYKEAYQYDRENSGLIYYHPMMLKGKKFLTTLVTGLGFSETVDLNEYVFALQVRVTPTKQELSKLLLDGDIPSVEKRLQQIAALYLSSFANGIFDHDHNFLDNTGFYQGRAIRHDVGKVVYDPIGLNERFIRADGEKLIKQRLLPWLQTKTPEHAIELSEAMGYCFQVER